MKNGTTTSTDTRDDQQLVAACRSGDTKAFESLVIRYQNLVCSIAYSVIGDLAMSEDLGQESFVAAWQTIDSLEDPSRFKSWICSIARNKSLNAVRRQRSVSLEATMVDPTYPTPSQQPEDELVQQEEQAHVWRMLSGLPLQFREPLVLYYRQNQSVTEVAASLDLSRDVVKQRLARGRNLLREEVLASIGRQLSQSVPRTAFTAAVLVAVGSLGAKTAIASTTAIASAAAGKTLAGGSAGKAGVGSLATVGSATVLGTILAIGGGVFATWLQWSLIRYENQRKLAVRFGVFHLLAGLLFSVPYIAIAFGWRPWDIWTPKSWWVFNTVWIVGYALVSTISVVGYLCLEKAMAVRNRDENLKPLPVGRLAAWFDQRDGFHWQSSWQILGQPVVDIHFGPLKNISYPTRYRWARAWIAIGDIAVGRLMGVGYFAVAPIAIGNMVVGFVSIATMGIGFLALGVIAVGVFCGGIVGVGWNVLPWI